MRILAVDPGSKRVGLALSDPSGTIASALVTVAAQPYATLAARLAAIAREQEAVRIVVGLPRRLDGSRGPEAAAAERLAAEIRAAAGLPVETVDERLTTAMAERSLIEGGVSRAKRRESIDRVAATLLLQSHLDRLHANKRRAG
jgi:putative holliday junction resolvase